MTPSEQAAVLAVEDALRRLDCDSEFEAHSDLEMEADVAWVVGVEPPGDLHLLLLAMRFLCLAPERRAWTGTVGMILYLLDRDESHCPDWDERLVSMPQDCADAIRLWLDAVSEWPDVREERQAEVARVMRQWRRG